jgi:hypothetical protein
MSARTEYIAKLTSQVTARQEAQAASAATTEQSAVAQMADANKGLPLGQSDKPTVISLPRNERIKILPNAERVFKNRISIVADFIEQIRPGYDGVGRLMETAFTSGGMNDAVAFREWLLRQKKLSERARQALLDYKQEVAPPAA